MKAALCVIAMIVLVPWNVHAQSLNCDLSGYKDVDGLRATLERDALVVRWNGVRDNEVQARFVIDNGRPLVRELAVRAKSGDWGVIGRNLAPEFAVTTGRRRVDELRLRALRDLGQPITPETIEREKWVSSWDAPLSVPGVASGHLGRIPEADALRKLVGLPRSADEIRHAKATYTTSRCEVKTDGARIEVSFDGLSMGVFAGRVAYTVFKGTNLIRLEAIAKTEEPSVAYKYDGGLSGFDAQKQRIKWRDTGGDWQKYEFGGTPNIDSVPLRARQRAVVVEGASGSIAAFPPPHKFFFSRQVEINLGYVYYRKNDATSFAVGVRHADRDEPFKVQAKSVDYRRQAIGTAERFADANFALYNAPPGTWQRMAVFFYVSPAAAIPTYEAVMAFTNGDRYRPLAGHQVLMSHIHPPFSDELDDLGTLDVQSPWIPAVKARGVNIVMITDRGSSAPDDQGPIRFARLKHHYDAARRHADVDFAIVSGEEQTRYFPDGGGGHWISYFPKPVFWSQSRGKDQPFVEQHPEFGTVYHVGSSADMLELLKRENGAAWMAHQRVKFDLPDPNGYLERIRNSDYFRSDYYLGGEYRANVPNDLSWTRMAEHAFVAFDDMNNRTVGAGLKPKSLHASSDTYMKYPEDDIYPQAFVNYVKLDRVPTLDDGATFMRALRDAQYFVSSGEILLKEFAIEGSGAQRKVSAEFDWTFPLDFIEVVWGDGTTTDRQIISTKDLSAFGSKRITMPIDTRKAKWVRVAAWDVAGNGAFSQPIRLETTPVSTNAQ